MKLTKSELREIIKEELGRLNENLPGFSMMKTDELDADDKQLGRTLSTIVGGGSFRGFDHVLGGDGEVAFAFLHPIKLSKQAMQKLSSLSKEVVIKKSYTYIIT